MKRRLMSRKGGRAKSRSGVKSAGRMMASGTGTTLRNQGLYDGGPLNINSHNQIDGLNQGATTDDRNTRNVANLKDSILS